MGRSPCPTLPGTIGLFLQTLSPGPTSLLSQNSLGLMTLHRLRHPSSYLHNHTALRYGAASELTLDKPLSSSLEEVWLLRVRFSSLLFGHLLLIWDSRTPSEPRCTDQIISIDIGYSLRVWPCAGHRDRSGTRHSSLRLKAHTCTHGKVAFLQTDFLVRHCVPGSVLGSLCSRELERK